MKYMLWGLKDSKETALGEICSKYITHCFMDPVLVRMDEEGLRYVQDCMVVKYVKPERT